MNPIFFPCRTPRTMPWTASILHMNQRTSFFLFYLPAPPSYPVRCAANMEDAKFPGVGLSTSQKRLLNGSLSRASSIFVMKMMTTLQAPTGIGGVLLSLPTSLNLFRFGLFFYHLHYPHSSNSLCGIDILRIYYYNFCSPHFSRLIFVHHVLYLAFTSMNYPLKICTSSFKSSQAVS